MRKKLLSPDSVNRYEYGYELAYKVTGEQLARIADIKDQCLKSGAKYQVEDSKTLIILDYLNQSYRITFPDIDVSPQHGSEPVPVKDKILMLHYLAQAKGTPLSSRLITYKELPEGTTYFPTFVKRAIKPLVDHFGNEPGRLPTAAEILGGRKADLGNASVTINAFSRVPITFVLWRGDAEFPPEGNIIFDSSISDYLTTEDINVLCEAIAWRLVKLLRGESKKP